MMERVANHEEMIAGAAGDLFVRSWRSAAEARAIIVICHGFNSHSEYYQWSGQRLADAGFATFALDLRGRGRSGGERFHVGDFDDYVADLHLVVGMARAREPSLPVFVLGHSAGGVIGTLYALDYGAEVAGFICEDFAFELPAPDVALAILKGLSHVAPHAHVLTLNNADFTRDSTVLSTMNADPLIAKESQPLATVAALVRADERLRRSFALVTCPVLIIHGAEDKAAKPAGSERFFKEAGSIDKSLKVYEGRLHDPLNDLGREDVLADIIAWIGARLTSQEQGAKA